MTTYQTEAQYKAAKKKAAAKKKPAAKQKPAAKTNPAAKQKPATVEIDSKVLAAAKKALPQIRSGEITIRSVWRDKLKLESIGPLRNALTKILGGKKQYLAMLKARAKKKKAATGKG